MEDEDVNVLFFPQELDVFKSTKTAPSFSRNPLEALNQIHVSSPAPEADNLIGNEIYPLEINRLYPRKRENSAEDIYAFNSLGFGLTSNGGKLKWGYFPA